MLRTYYIWDIALCVEGLCCENESLSQPRAAFWSQMTSQTESLLVLLHCCLHLHVALWPYFLLFWMESAVSNARGSHKPANRKPEHTCVTHTKTAHSEVERQCPTCTVTASGSPTKALNLHNYKQVWSIVYMNKAVQVGVDTTTASEYSGVKKKAQRAAASSF